MELYPLDVKDIEAIARSRSNRSIPQNIKNWMYGGCGVFIVGIAYWVLKGGWVSLAIMVVGAGLVWYSNIQVDKRRKKAVWELKRAWREEREKMGGKV